MRQESDVMVPKIIHVSIHASVKDATSHLYGFLYLTYGFNPRIRKGCDVTCTRWQRKGLCFNPRIRKGCDSFRHVLCCDQIGFNPRIRKGCDHAINAVGAAVPVSIHASVKDATMLTALITRSAEFQSTHP